MILTRPARPTGTTGTAGAARTLLPAGCVYRFRGGHNAVIDDNVDIPRFRDEAGNLADMDVIELDIDGGFERFVDLALFLGCFVVLLDNGDTHLIRLDAAGIRAFGRKFRVPDIALYFTPEFLDLLAFLVDIQIDHAKRSLMQAIGRLLIIGLDKQDFVVDFNGRLVLFRLDVLLAPIEELIDPLTFEFLGRHLRGLIFRRDFLGAVPLEIRDGRRIGAAGLDEKLCLALLAEVAGPLIVRIQGERAVELGQRLIEEVLLKQCHAFSDVLVLGGLGLIRALG